MRIAPQAGVLAGLHRSYVFAAAATVIVLLGLVPEFVGLLHQDQSWYLQAAGRLLDGVRPYVDQFIEMNPPLIMWLNVVPAAIARALELSPVMVFRLSVVVLALVSVRLCQPLLAQLLGPEQRVLLRYWTLLLLFALFPLPGGDFGQREHLLFALVFPYVLLAVCRVEGKPVGSWTAFMIGVMAGVGLALKPFFFAFWLLLEGWIILKAGRRVLEWHAERLAVITTSAVYLIAVALWTPEYFDLVRLLSGWQRTYLHKSLLQLTMFRVEAWLTLGSVLALIAVWRAVRLRSLWTALALGAVGCLWSAVLQGKGFSYHYYPSVAFVLVLLGGLAADITGPLSISRRRLSVAALGAGVITMAASTIVASFIRLRDGLHWRRTELGQVIAFVRDHGASHRVFLLNSGLRESVIATYSGAQPVSRLMHLGLLNSAYQEAIQSPSPLQYHRPQDMAAIERYVLRTVVADFQRNQPLLLLVRGPGPDQPDDPTPVLFERWGRFDYVAYFSRDSSFAQLFRRYTYIGTIGHYHAYRRLREGEARVPPPARAAAGAAPRETSWSDLLLGPANRSLLLFLISFCVVAGRVGRKPERRAHDDS